MSAPVFVGDVKTLWLRDQGAPDRNMQLLEDFKFIDSRGVEWLAPAGSVVDGASIPRVLWSTVGDPFIGDYRRATVLHDVACDEKARPHEEVHRMFYDAMRADGVSHDRATIMYTAVRLFGPKWIVAAAAAGPEEMAAAPAVPVTPVDSDNIDEVMQVLDRAMSEKTDW